MPPPSDSVLEFLCNRRFHRRLTLPPNPTAGRPSPYHISYADYGDATSKSVVLFFGGLMGGRLSYSPLDTLARTHQIRIIHADRPGTGGSDAVTLSQRIQTYVTALPELLAHLEIDHVALAAHSFGTIYLINTLLLFPQLLHPTRPCVAFFAPWVHPQHTGVAHLKLAEHLPASLIGGFTSVAKFVNGTIAPMSGMSAGLSTSFVKCFTSLSTHSQPTTTTTTTTTATAIPTPSQRPDAHVPPSLDLSNPDTITELRTLIPTFAFAEPLDGVDQDAQLCLRKPRSVPWSVPPLEWNDVNDAVSLFLESVTRDAPAIPQSTHMRGGRGWSISTYHAATDSMVGRKGGEWFDACWREASDVGRGDVRYQSRVVEGADHDFILDPGFGASGDWLRGVRRAFNDGEGGV
ncbi:hypothetical protein EKO04_009289 [Ascochyta lentis]|uniref:AB hydrolase-1 domain-containing protein n=1 Tax=Ascochyta lentis TaxID=205686 RepID=A0A8H7MF65_9PLEO|nr:hypothetical protein EKO04_009289 [Ascochyta lentis]